jgi:uncharacterized membrane protein
MQDAMVAGPKITSPGRLHALIDGVFAIAVTLLVLDLPDLPGSHDFVHRLFDQWPTYAAYLVSFASIGIIWIEHHGMMSAVRFINRRFLERTLVFLLFVSVVPWPTKLAADHIRDGGSAAAAVAVLYAAVMMLMGLSMAASWRYLRNHAELVAPAARPAMNAGAQRALLGALAYAPSLILAPLLPSVSLGFDAAIAVYFAVSRNEVPGLVHTAALKAGETPDSD